MTTPSPPPDGPVEQPTAPVGPLPDPGDTAPVAPAATEVPEAPAKRRWLPRRKAEEPAPDGATPDGAAEAVTEDAPAPEAPADDAVAAPSAEAMTDARTSGSPRSLRRDRRKLITRREEAVYHLGGLAFELYRRDLLTEDVMRKRAGEVAEIDDTVRDIDVRLGEIDKERRDRRRGEPADTSAGCCLVCRTPFRAEARFCWQCGAQLVPPSVGDEQVTAVISTGQPES